MPGFVFVACLVCIDSEYVKLEKRSDNFLIINCHLVGEQFLSMLKMQNIDMHEILIDIIRSATFSINYSRSSKAFQCLTPQPFKSIVVWMQATNNVTRIETAQFMKRIVFNFNPSSPSHHSQVTPQSGEQTEVIYFHPNVVFVHKSEFLGVLYT